MIGVWHDAIKLLLSTEATFTAAIAALGLGSAGENSVPQITVSNRELQSFPVDSFPSWVMVPGDGEAQSISNGGGEFLSVGGGEQTFRVELETALIWHQQDFEAAYVQRRDLPVLLAQLLMRNQGVIGGAEACWLERWQNDRSARHPVQVANFTIAADFIIPRSP